MNTIKTLAFETSSQPGAVALLDGPQVVHEVWLPEPRRTTESFATQIREALQHVGWRPRDIRLFAVCEGPGSFTGLRIGITAAKTFAYATGCQLVAINTLAVIARQAAVEREPVWAVMDAQRKQLFVAAYEVQDGQPRELAPPQIVDAATWIAALPPAVVTGPGLRNWRASLPSHVTVVPDAHWQVRAGVLGQLAVQRLAQGHTVDLWQLVPRYYRPSAAEEKRRRS